MVASIAWRPQHFVAFPRNEDGYVRHYVQFLERSVFGSSSSYFTMRHLAAWSSSIPRTARRPRSPTDC